MVAKEPTNARYAKALDTEGLRNEYLLDTLFAEGTTNLVYCHEDRVIVGGSMPTNKEERLELSKEIGTQYFLERRELGCFNIGAPGRITADGQTIELGTNDAVYIPKGTKQVSCSSSDPNEPACFYLVSTPAHAEYPLKKISINEAANVKLGSPELGNVRTIYQFIHPDVLDTCQLSMGLTMLEKGSLWNTMPPHSHGRRIEVYLYFNIPEDQAVFHIMGTPDETRHLVVRNRQAVLSPSWSIHSGVGTSSYTFIWAMAGENRTFTDMDNISINDLK